MRRNGGGERGREGGTIKNKRNKERNRQTKRANRKKAKKRKTKKREKKSKTSRERNTDLMRLCMFIPVYVHICMFDLGYYYRKELDRNYLNRM